MNDATKSLCDCGSGLTPGHCCDVPDAAPQTARPNGAIGRGRPAKAEPPPPPATPSPELAAKIGRAMDAFEAKDRGTAERLCLEILEEMPDRPRALQILAAIREEDKKVPAVAALLGRLIKIEPQNFWAVNKLALLELGRGDANEAEIHARHAVRLAPENPQAHNLMGMAMTEQHRAVVGEYHCRRALELAGKRIPLVIANLATNLTNQGRIEEARALYRESDELAPNVRQTLMSWARMEEADRKLDAANKLLDQVSALSPNNAGVTLTRATILGREKRYEEAVALLDSAKAKQQGNLRPVEKLERGRLLDKLGRYDEAWADFCAGKARAKELSGNAYHEDEAANMAERLKGCFTRSALDLMPRAGVRSDVAQPIFILGFPRSGTTLLEQTLSASPEISAGDELPLIHLLAGVMPRLFDSPLQYPEALSELWMGDRREGLDDLRDLYLQKARQLGVMPAGAKYFTDKMPLNEMHLGLIALVFPKAPLLHVIRHPLDIMVSAMSNFFTHGLFCGAELESAAKHLVLSADMVEHYRKEMDLNYLPVRYEDVVGDQEKTIRRVFDSVGATFDPAVLRFESNVRYARTASYQQVTEKLYDRSLYRYRNYRKHLEPAIPILQPLIDRLGYIVEG